MTGRLRPVPALTALVLLGPVLAGLAGVLLPAFGHLPAAGFTGPSPEPFRQLARWPGLPGAVRLSVTTGLAATSLSLAVVLLVVAGWQGTAPFRWLTRVLSPLLSVPHAAAAFGLAFLITPSGWIARAFSPWATGWDVPPDVLVVQDPMGLAMTAGLVAKEFPFLLLMTLAALGQADADRSLTVARSLGHGRIAAWFLAVLPRVYPQIRLPVYVVLAYSMSVVDVAVILGPNTPPTLAVQITRWMADPDLALRLLGAAAALLQLALVLGALALWWAAERIAAQLGHRVIRSGRRLTSLDRTARALGLGLGGLCALAVLLGLLGLAVWSVAGFWAFPDLLPDTLTTRTWMRHAPGMADALGATAVIAALAVIVALCLAIGSLEAEYRYGLTMTRRVTWLLYLPLLVPQIAFLPGLQILFLSLGAKDGLWPVVLVHIVFVLPYVFLSLSQPFRAWDTRLGRVACALGAGPDRVLWRIRLPMLLAPLLTAIAVGLAVSVGQYLPTLLVGGGRVDTLTTEAVALASGGDRRAIGAWGLVQTAAALLPFALAVLLPPLIWRNRRGLRLG